MNNKRTVGKHFSNDELVLLRENINLPMKSLLALLPGKTENNISEHARYFIRFPKDSVQEHKARLRKSKNGAGKEPRPVQERPIVRYNEIRYKKPCEGEPVVLLLIDGRVIRVKWSTTADKMALETSLFIDGKYPRFWFHDYSN